MAIPTVLIKVKNLKTLQMGESAKLRGLSGRKFAWVTWVAWICKIWRGSKKKAWVVWVGIFTWVMWVYEIVLLKKQ